MKELVNKYLVYVIYFLGIGMTASGIVLMPFNPTRYGIIMVIGLTLFGAGSIFNEVVIDQHDLSPMESIRLIGLSLSLAIGIGMISGGIAHFKESPMYVSVLIPSGIVISFFSFWLKNKFKLNKKEKMIAVISVLIIAVFVFFMLFSAATFMLGNGVEAGGDIFNSNHGM